MGFSLELAINWEQEIAWRVLILIRLILPHCEQRAIFGDHMALRTGRKILYQKSDIPKYIYLKCALVAF